MEAQGYEVKKNILYQDNKSAILLETNGKKSSSKRTRAINIRYFFMTDQVQKGNVMIKYCPTAEMTGDYMTKPLQGKLFEKFCNQIMGYNVSPSNDGDRSVLKYTNSSTGLSTATEQSVRRPRTSAVPNPHF